MLPARPGHGIPRSRPRCGPLHSGQSAYPYSYPQSTGTPPACIQTPPESGSHLPDPASSGHRPSARPQYQNILFQRLPQYSLQSGHGACWKELQCGFPGPLIPEAAQEFPHKAAHGKDNAPQTVWCRQKVPLHNEGVPYLHCTSVHASSASGIHLPQIV